MKILRNITNISSGASFPLISPLAHRLSSFWHPLSHPDSATPPFHLPPETTSDERGGCGRQRCMCHCCRVCVCLSVAGWQRNNNNAACPTIFIRLHKLIRPQCSHHLFYWEWREEHSQEMWDFECWSAVAWLWVCIFWGECQMECDAVIWVLQVEQKWGSFDSTGDLTRCMWFVGMCE